MTANKALRVVGIDPGSVHMGFGVLEDLPGRAPKMLEYGVFSPNSSLPLARRLLYMFNGLQELIQTFAPQEMALESIFAGRNLKSAFILGHARGVALLAAGQQEVDVFEYAPRTVKKALAGSGAAAKEQVRHMVGALLNVELKALPLDASDALALGLCHLNSRGLYLKGVL